MFNTKESLKNSQLLLTNKSEQVEYLENELKKLGGGGATGESAFSNIKIEGDEEDEDGVPDTASHGSVESV